MLGNQWNLWKAKALTEGPVVYPDHTAGLSQQGLTAAQLDPTRSVTPTSLKTETWKHCLLSPKARVLLSNQSLASLYLIINTSTPA